MNELQAATLHVYHECAEDIVPDDERWSTAMLADYKIALTHLDKDGGIISRFLVSVDPVPDPAHLRS